MPKVRKDNKGRNLRPGETQRSDGSYMFVYKLGKKKKYIYPQVAEQLRTLIEVMDTLYPEDLVMNGYHGFLFRNREGYFLSAHNINRAIQRISIAYNAEEMDQAELEDREPELLPHFSVHNMRHTFCTRLCESTNDIKFIQQVMGHADFSTTMDIYTHITQENMREKAEAIKGNLVLM